MDESREGLEMQGLGGVRARSELAQWGSGGAVPWEGCESHHHVETRG